MKRFLVRVIRPKGTSDKVLLLGAIFGYGFVLSFGLIMIWRYLSA